MISQEQRLRITELTTRPDQPRVPQLLPTQRHHLWVQFSMIINHNLDSLFVQIEFIIRIGFYLNQIIPITKIIDIWNAIGYNCDTYTICRITMGINIHGILDGMTLVSVLIALAVVFGEINSNLDKIGESECGYGGNSNVSRKNATRGVAPLSLYKLFLVIVAIWSIVKAMDVSSLHVVLSIEFDLVPQLELNLFIESPNIAGYCDIEMIHICQQDLMCQLALISLVLVLLHMVYQMALCAQVHKPTVIFFMVVVQCEILSMLIFQTVTFGVDNLFKLSVFTSFVAALAMIIGAIGSNIMKMNEYKCCYDGVGDITMILSNFDQSRVKTEILWVAIYRMEQTTVESLLIILVLIAFEAFMMAIYQYTFNLSLELAIIFGFELGVIGLIVVFVFDLSTVEYEFLIIIHGWVMRIEFCNGIKNNCNRIVRITIRIDVDGALNGMFSVINISIKVSISRLFLDALMTIVDRINSNIEKIPEIEYGYDNGNVTILVNNLSKINNGATFVGGIFLAVIFFIVQVIGGASLIIRISIKSNAITVAIVQLNINLAAQSSSDVAICHAQVMHNVEQQLMDQLMHNTLLLLIQSNFILTNNKENLL